MFLGCSQVVPELVTVQRAKLRLCRWQQLLASWASTPSVTHAPTPANIGPANLNQFDNCFRGHPSSQTVWPCVKKEVQLQFTNCRSRDNRSRSVPKHAPSAQCSTALQNSCSYSIWPGGLHGKTVQPTREPEAHGINLPAVKLTRLGAPRSTLLMAPALQPHPTASRNRP